MSGLISKDNSQFLLAFIPFNYHPPGGHGDNCDKYAHGSRGASLAI